MRDSEEKLGLRILDYVRTEIKKSDRNILHGTKLSNKFLAYHVADHFRVKAPVPVYDKLL